MNWPRTLLRLVPRDRKKIWEKKWRNPDFTPDWRKRGIAPEIVQAVEEGWLPQSGSVLDLGCGEGEIAAWFAQRHFNAVGTDIAPSAIQRAIKLSSTLPQPPRFVVQDITAGSPPDLSYDIVVDRGCLHGIPLRKTPDYVRNLCSVCSPHCRMILYVRAFRNGVAFDDPAERHEKIHWVQEIFDQQFNLYKHRAIDLGIRIDGTQHAILPGMVFWLIRSNQPTQRS